MSKCCRVPGVRSEQGSTFSLALSNTPCEGGISITTEVGGYVDKPGGWLCSWVSNQTGVLALTSWSFALRSEVCCGSHIPFQIAPLVR